MTLNRRQFAGRSLAAAFAGLAACSHRAGVAASSKSPLGPLQKDPAGLLDLPQDFSYRIISAFGDPMDDGGTVPDRADGMGAFAGPGGQVILVCNHELAVRHVRDAGYGAAAARATAYDRTADGNALGGGTTTLHYDPAAGKVVRQFRSLSGTIRNCAGGITPWGSWLSCEEDVSRAGYGGIGADHGYVFEIPAAATGETPAVPLKAMGRFNHEAAAVDPRTGIVYMTEDRDDSLLYRYIPDVPGQLAGGGQLQALALAVADTRNWAARTLAVRAPQSARWITLDNPESPADDLRMRGAALGCTLFARGEGIKYGDGALYFTCTSGGAAKLGQVFRLRPGRARKADKIDLYYESTTPSGLNFGDNLTVAPGGCLIISEDQYSDPVDNHVRVITPRGDSFALARLRVQTESAGACFAPDGRTLFLNIYSPAKTLAISGPWQKLLKA
ncbi:MAG: hypothetical protein RLZZ58_1503 [Pseudomonadota bacterium]